MPGGGDHCCIVGCGANNLRHKGLSFHQIPKVRKNGNSADREEWRRKMISAVCRADKSLNPNTAHICSRHFEDDCFETFGQSRRLKPFSLPTKFIPQKNVLATSIVKTRKEPTFRPPPDLPKIVFYYTIEELKCDVMKIMGSMPGWSMQVNGTEMALVLKESTEYFASGKLCIVVKDDLTNYIKIREQTFQYPEDAMETKGAKAVLLDLESIILCTGVTDKELQQYADIRSSGTSSAANFYRLVQPVLSSGTYSSLSTIYSESCLLAVKSAGICQRCAHLKQLLVKKHEHANAAKIILPNTKLSSLEPKQMVSLLKTCRKENKDLRAKLGARISEESIEVDKDTHSVMQDIMDSKDIPDEFVRLFWEQQKKAFKTNEKGMRWHPTMLRFAFMLHSYSDKAYKMLRDTGVLKLPGTSTLRAYVNVDTPSSRDCS